MVIICRFLLDANVFRRVLMQTCSYWSHWEASNPKRNQSSSSLEIQADHHNKAAPMADTILDNGFVWVVLLLVPCSLSLEASSAA